MLLLFWKVSNKAVKKQTVINLGTAHLLNESVILRRGVRTLTMTFSKVLTSAPMYKPIMADIFGCTENRVEVMGNPVMMKCSKKTELRMTI